ncbi:MAG: phosphotransferase [Candidatus Latescibacteria bacterium]|nr:phosphotransferase [Candidatus Latescibacterota bacterium]
MIEAKNITPAWLSERLHRTVASIEHGEPFESGQTDWTPLAIRFADDSTTNILHKRYRPDYLEWGLQERGFYQHCAGQMEAPIFATCYDHGLDGEERIAWLLVEDLKKTHQPHRQDAQEEEIRKAIPTLVALHARWWKDDILNLDILQNAHGGACRMANACSPENIRVQADHWLNHELPRSREQVGETFTDAMADLCTRAIQRWPDLLIDRIGDGAQMTLIHGDAHLENMFFPLDASTQKTKLVDWETWERGIPAYDLAYLLMFHPQMEEEAMAAYYDGLVAAGVTDYSRDRFELDYRLSVLCCLFPPIMWVRNWGGVWVLEKAIGNCERWDCAELLHAAP